MSNVAEYSNSTAPLEISKLVVSGAYKGKEHATNTIVRRVRCKNLPYKEGFCRPHKTVIVALA